MAIQKPVESVEVTRGENNIICIVTGGCVSSGWVSDNLGKFGVLAPPCPPIHHWTLFVSMSHNFDAVYDEIILHFADSIYSCLLENPQ